MRRKQQPWQPLTTSTPEGVRCRVIDPTGNRNAAEYCHRYKLIGIDLDTVHVTAIIQRVGSDQVRTLRIEQVEFLNTEQI